jgi:hypothetical protein
MKKLTSKLNLSELYHLGAVLKGGIGTFDVTKGRQQPKKKEDEQPKPEPTHDHIND